MVQRLSWFSIFINVPVYFHSEYPKFDLKPKLKYKKWLSDVIHSENKSTGNINFIFVSDEELFEINNKYLQHDTYTDIITFDYSEDKKVSADIFISIDRVRENSIKYATTAELELNRVMVHGVLHLLDYNDITNQEKTQMRKMEEKYLSLLD